MRSFITPARPVSYSSCVGGTPYPNRGPGPGSGPEPTSNCNPNPRQPRPQIRPSPPEHTYRSVIGAAVFFVLGGVTFTYDMPFKIVYKGVQKRGMAAPPPPDAGN